MKRGIGVFVAISTAALLLVFTAAHSSQGQTVSTTTVQMTVPDWVGKLALGARCDHTHTGGRSILHRPGQ